jgi:ribosomal protein S18 acetylase RimI-like enzyme
MMCAAWPTANTKARSKYSSTQETRVAAASAGDIGLSDRTEAKARTVPHPLDNPVLASLTGPHARFAERRGNVLRYPVDVCPFVALPDQPGEADWTDAARLAGPGAWLPLAAIEISPPPGWEVRMIGEGTQMTGDDLDDSADQEAVPLGPADVPEMLELTARTKPGPFLPRTSELGTYLGIRREGRLVAMAGERLHPAGWTEISAVCTDEAWRGQGLAARLIRAVGAGIRARGEIPFLHALATNAAIGLYEQLGFRHRMAVLFALVRVPRT